MSEAKIKLTRTMLDKYIIDANASVVALALAAWGVDYSKIVGSGVKFEFLADVEVVGGEGRRTWLRFYCTKRGDKRLSIAKIGSFAKAGDEIRITKPK